MQKNVDLFLMDDIQYTARKQQTQNELIYAFNSIFEAGNQLVFASDQPPREIITFDDRLRTRFVYSLMADIQPPDLETRMAIIYQKSAQLDLRLSDDVVDQISVKITSNIASLEGVIKKLSAYRDFQDETITIGNVDRAIKEVLSIENMQPISSAEKQTA